MNFQRFTSNLSIGIGIVFLLIGAYFYLSGGGLNAMMYGTAEGAQFANTASQISLAWWAYIFFGAIFIGIGLMFRFDLKKQENHFKEEEN